MNTRSSRSLTLSFYFVSLIGAHGATTQYEWDDEGNNSGYANPFNWRNDTANTNTNTVVPPNSLTDTLVDFNFDNGTASPVEVMLGASISVNRMRFGFSGPEDDWLLFPTNSSYYINVGSGGVNQASAGNHVEIATSVRMQSFQNVIEASTGNLEFSGPTFDLNGHLTEFNATPSRTIFMNTFLTGSGAIIKSGSGTMVLNSPTTINNFSGTFTVGDGLVQNGAGLNIPDTTDITLNGGNWDLNGQTETIGGLFGSDPTSQFDVGGGVLSMGSSINQVSGAFGGRFVGDGEINIYASSNPGYTLDFAHVAYTGEMHLQTGGLHFAQHLPFSSGSVPQVLMDTENYTEITADGDLAFGDLAGGGGINASTSNLYVGNRGGSPLYFGYLNIHGLTKLGSGTWLLGGLEKTYSQFSIQEGTVYTVNDSVLDSAKPVAISTGARLRIDSTDQVTSYITGGGTLEMDNGATPGLINVSFDSGVGDRTFSGDIIGFGDVQKSGSGTWILNGTNHSYDGTTTVTDSGTLRSNYLAPNRVLNIALSNSAFELTASDGTRNLEGQGALRLLGVTFTLGPEFGEGASGTNLFNGAIAGEGAVNSLFILNERSFEYDYSGFSNPGTKVVDYQIQNGSTFINVNPMGIRNGATMDVDANSELVLQSTIDSREYGQTFTGAGQITIDSLYSIETDGDFDGFTGLIDVTDGDALTSYSSFLNSTLNVDGGAGFAGALDLNIKLITGTGSVWMRSNKTLTLGTDNASWTLRNPFSTDEGTARTNVSLLKEGTGSLTMTGDNTGMRGILDVSSGEVIFGMSHQFSEFATLNVDVGATADADDNDMTFGQLTGSGTLAIDQSIKSVILNLGNTQLTGNDSATFSGTIQEDPSASMPLEISLTGASEQVFNFQTTTHIGNLLVDGGTLTFNDQTLATRAGSYDWFVGGGAAGVLNLNNMDGAIHGVFDLSQNGTEVNIMGSDLAMTTARSVTVFVKDGTVFDVSASTLVLPRDIRVESGTLNVTDSTLEITPYNEYLRFLDGQVNSVNSSLDGSLEQDGGTFSVSGGTHRGRGYFNDGIASYSDADLDLNMIVDGGDVSVNGGDFSGVLRMDNGDLQLNGASANLSSLTANGGIVDVQSSVVDFGWTYDNGGLVTFGPADISLSGHISIGSGGLFGENLTIGSNQFIHSRTSTTIDRFNTLTIEAGAFRTGSLSGSGSFVWSGGTFGITGYSGLSLDSANDLDPFDGHLVVGSGKRFEVTNTLAVEVGSGFEVAQGRAEVGLLEISGTAQLSSGTLKVTDDGSSTIFAGGALYSSSVLDNASSLTNNGTIQLRNGSGRIIGSGSLMNNALFTGDGVVKVAFTNAAGGEVRVGAAEDLLFTETFGTNIGDITLQGGTLELDEVLVNHGYIQGQGTLRSNADGTAVTNENGGIIAFTGNAQVFGDFENTGTGRVLTSGGGITTFYGDVVHNGTEIKTSAGAGTVFLGELTGSGSFTGTGTVYIEGDLRPGNSPGMQNHAGDLVLDSPSTTTMEIGGYGQGTEYDFINVAGTLTLGGTLQIILSDGFVPVDGDSFDLFDAQIFNGSFVQVITADLSEGLEWDLSQLASAGIASVQSTAVDPYDAWTTFWDLSGADAELIADLTGDGIINMVHFAFDTNPMGGGAEGRTRVEIANDGEHLYLTYTFPMLVDDTFVGINYDVAGDDDLVGEDLEVVERTPLDSGMPTLRDIDGDEVADWEYRSYRLTVSIDLQTRGFIQVSVSELP
ncbi:MAG: beta strand repeat-containing protein [Opitutaceae bacterium]